MLPILLLIVCFQLSQPLSVFAMCYRYDCCYTASLGITPGISGVRIASSLVFTTIVCRLVLFPLVIELSVLLSFSFGH